MNKRDLMLELSGRMGVTQTECGRFLTCLCEVIQESLRSDNPVKLTGVGRLYNIKQSTRPGRNPRTGVVCPIPERISAKFKPSKDLIRVLNPNQQKNR